MEIASQEGLEGLSLGRLANELGLSKSGVFVLFGSKEELQLATVRAAIRIYMEHVVQPTQQAETGLARVWLMSNCWLDYSRQRVFPGGCFFYSVSAEFDAREGKVHDAVAAARADWVGFVEQTVEEARETGEIESDTDAPQLAFEIIALLEAANAESVLHNDFTCYDKARRGIRSRLLSVSTGASEPSPLSGTD